ncbi:MAG: hypothetical protein A3E88_03650 [Legionellales bacterium RIFCSPHIGHO2_12_FULL_35_11]|nr:MAG: hypothetical protein A3E88_03650 [Legionellales bacterium RIFCSPHIGHO2_12_FULL_35_11]
MLRATLAAIIAFLFFLIAHFLDFHYLMPIDKTNSILWTATFGLILLALILRYLPEEKWFQEKLKIDDLKMKKFVYPLLSALFYGFLFLGYMEFYFTADRSITFRMLMIINKEPKHSISRDEMFKKYDVPGIIDKRFNDLTYGSYLTQKGEIYQLTPKGVIILNIYACAIKFLHLDSGEKNQD